MKLLLNKLALYFIAVNLLDAISTYIAIEKYGGEEANLIMAPLIEWGWIQFFIVKLITACFVSWLLLKFKLRTVLIISICLTGLVALANIAGIIVVNIMCGE